MDSKSVTSAGSRITECSICFEEFVIPRSLPCLHTFCSHCLVSHIRKNVNRNYNFSCPLCRAEIPLKSSINGGESLVDQFPKNNFVTYIQENLYDIRTRMKRDIDELRKEKIFLKDFYETELQKLKSQEREHESEKEQMVIKHRQEYQALENEIHELKEVYQKELQDFKQCLDSEIFNLAKSHQHEKDALSAHAKEMNDQHFKEMNDSREENRAVTDNLMKQLNEARLRDETTAQNLLRRHKAAMQTAIYGHQQKIEFLQKRLDEESSQKASLRHKLENEIKRRNCLVLKLEGSLESTHQTEMLNFELQQLLDEEKRKCKVLEKENENILSIELDQKRKLHVVSLLFQASKLKQKRPNNTLEYTKDYPSNLWGDVKDISENIPYPTQAVYALEQYIRSSGTVPSNSGEDGDISSDEVSTIVIDSAENIPACEKSQKRLNRKFRNLRNASRRVVIQTDNDNIKLNDLSARPNDPEQKEDNNGNTHRSMTNRRENIMTAYDWFSGTREDLKQYDQSKKELFFKFKKLNQLPRIKNEKK